MADAPVAEPPPHVLHTGTTYVLVAGNGEALVLDCGAPGVVERLRQWQREGLIGAVEALWISHFHDDHVDAVPDFLAAFPGCPVFADERVSEVLARPEAYRLPCQSPHPVSVTRPLADGETWPWRDFTLTSRWFPGQTIHHGALLAVGRGHRVFFIGDSFTPTGMDDYCAYHRNLLREDGGYARCLRLVREHNPALLLNCHVDAGFRLEEAQLGFLERNLAERRRLFGALLPWPDPDFGLDPEWARAYPYQQRARAGGGVRLQLHIDNHSREPLRFAGVPQPPPGWRAASPVGAVTVGGHGEGVLPFELGVPPETASGRYVVPITVRMGERDLGPIHRGGGGCPRWTLKRAAWESAGSCPAVRWKRPGPSRGRCQESAGGMPCLAVSGTRQGAADGSGRGPSRSDRGCPRSQGLTGSMSRHPPAPSAPTPRRPVRPLPIPAPALLGGIRTVPRGLRLPHARIQSPRREQGVVVALLDHAAPLQDQDAVCGARDAQAMGDDDGGPPAPEGQQAADDVHLRHGIDGRRRLIQHDQPGGGQHPPRQRQPQPLASGEIRPTEVGAQPEVQLGLQIRTGLPQGRQQGGIIVPPRQVAEAHVVPHGQGETHEVLQDCARGARPRRQRPPHAAGSRPVQPQQQRGQGALTRPIEGQDAMRIERVAHRP